MVPSGLVDAFLTHMVCCVSMIQSLECFDSISATTCPLPKGPVDHPKPWRATLSGTAKFEATESGEQSQCTRCPNASKAVLLQSRHTDPLSQKARCCHRLFFETRKRDKAIVRCDAIRCSDGSAQQLTICHHRSAS